MPNDALPGLERDTAEIVSAYVRHHQVSADQVAALIRSVYTALSNLEKPTEEEVERSPAVPIRRSVHRDYVVCLECGWRGKMLRRHIGTLHDLGPGEYRRRWGLSADHPLTAPGYSEARSGLAKQLGLGRHGRDGDTEASFEPEPQPEPEKPPSRRGRRQTSEQQSD
jgi:predicted transcriptional regulator